MDRIADGSDEVKSRAKSSVQRRYEMRKIAFSAVFVALGLVAGFILTARLGLSPFVQAQSEERAPVSAWVTESGESPFVRVAERVMPAVVNISAARVQKLDWGGREYMFDGPFEDFFRRFFGGRTPNLPEERRSEVLGSGFIFDRDDDGYLILTNNHVVEGAEQIMVRLSDETEYRHDDVEVVGRDPRTDVAVLRIKTDHDLPMVKLGNSDDIRVGDWCMAIGNPFTLERTVTVGVVSAKGRSGLTLPEGPSYQDFIQTDAAINFGNSGGPLVDIRGDVIGINSAIKSPSGGFVGIGFAIPVNLVRSVSDQLVVRGKVIRGYLGILPQDLTSDLAEAYGLDDRNGILVARVEEDTPAEKAGLEAGDVIIEFDGEKVTNVAQFRIDVADIPPDTKVSFKLLRESGKVEALHATLAEYPDLEISDVGVQEGGSSPGTASWLGLEVANVSAPKAMEYELDAGQKGALVIEVEPMSAASEAGIQEGDVIVKVSDRDIESVSDFQEARERHEGSDKPVVIKIERRGQPRFVAVRTDE
jgi:serine protease Do